MPTEKIPPGPTSEELRRRALAGMAPRCKECGGELGWVDDVRPGRPPSRLLGCTTLAGCSLSLTNPPAP